MLVASTFWSSLGAILRILGALGVFLFGMKVMSEGVQKVAGDRMRSALAGMTGNRVKGVITGLLATILVQSSSATTVLGESIGITVTAWLASLGANTAAKRAARLPEGLRNANNSLAKSEIAFGTAIFHSSTS